ncbi:hypothetical protein OHS33_26575 [Streptomyces sp. NBC_00536]|uniref:hypothetical protein n=1 Tax=Streptomyces sp. NBC_00536 TaxID=2975769 RepID=UPI002E8174CC|nr:hypothetical protein [Streptomyces sp. NBC_00536]WUC81588.1 hypothetical protein OHS33_26575 [Streptomyces sp. NBC_00536]
MGKNTTVRRAAGAAATALLLAGAAACGGAGQADKETGVPAPRTAAASTPPPAAPGPGADKLKTLTLAPGEKAGHYTADEPVLDEPMNESYEATPAVCQPLTSLGKAGHTAQAYAKTSGPGGIMQDASTEIVLRSYKDGGAAAALKSLAAAGKSCAGGYKEDRMLAEGTVLKVEPVPAPKLGDEAQAYRIVVQDVKEKNISLYKYLTVIRSGSVTLSFRSDMLDTKDFGGVPPEVVTAQYEKFAKGSGAA